MNKGLLVSAIVFIAIMVSIAVTVINFVKQQEQKTRLVEARQDLYNAESDLAQAQLDALLNK